MIVAKPLFIILYSERWLPSVPYFQILAFAGFAICLQAINLQAIAAIGRSKVMFVWTFIKRIIGILLIVLGLAVFGMEGLLVGMVLSSWIAYFINSWLVAKHIGYKMSLQMKDLFPIFLIASFSFIPAIIVGRVININLYVDSFLCFLVFMVIYLGTSIIMKLDAYIYCKGIIPLFLNKIKHRKQ